MRAMAITYRDDARLSVPQAIDLYRRSTLGERRPVDQPAVFEDAVELPQPLDVA